MELVALVCAACFAFGREEEATACFLEDCADFLESHGFQANQVRLWLSVIAYNLGNLWRRLALPARVANWSLTSLQHRLVKTGGPSD